MVTATTDFQSEEIGNRLSNDKILQCIQDKNLAAKGKICSCMSIPKNIH